MTAPVEDVTKYILRIGDLYDDGDGISNMKLQKLLYYFQGFHVAAFEGEVLFKDRIEAWEHGPVVPPVWKRFKDCGRQPIRQQEIHGEWIDNFEKDQLDLMTNVYDAYGQFSAWRLRQMTHREEPWKAARDRGDQTGDYTIEKDDLFQFFRPLLK